MIKLYILIVFIAAAAWYIVKANEWMKKTDAY